MGRRAKRSAPKGPGWVRSAKELYLIPAMQLSRTNRTVRSAAALRALASLAEGRGTAARWWGDSTQASPHAPLCRSPRQPKSPSHSSSLVK